MPVRKVIEIDQAKCDGCGLCVNACHEGAIELVDGKAVLVSDSYCDGLGDCLPECPQDAIAVVERDAAPFDAAAVAERQQRLAKTAAGKGEEARAAAKGTAAGVAATAAVPPTSGLAMHGGCPGAASRFLGAKPAIAAPRRAGQAVASSLANWPVQLHLAPVQAPYFKGARLLIAADCVPFALPDFHSQMLAGRTLLIGCPKLDDTSAYLQKLTAIIGLNDIASIEVAFMEVPCCGGLVRLVSQALAASGKGLSLELTKVGIRGEVLERIERPAPATAEAGRTEEPRPPTKPAGRVA